MKSLCLFLPLILLAAAPAYADESSVAQEKFAFVSGKKWECKADVANDLFEGGVVHMRGLLGVIISADRKVVGMTASGFTTAEGTFSRVYEVKGYAYSNSTDGEGFVLENFSVYREDTLPHGLQWGSPEYEIYTIRPTGWLSEPYELHLQSVTANAPPTRTVCHVHND